MIGAFLADNPGHGITVATKMGRRVEQVPENYVLANFREWTDRSRRNLGVDTLDLVQLHCPPTAVFASDEVYDALDTLVAEGAIANYGVSVETCDEALAAIARPGTATVQIILNAFRLKPLDEVLPAARGGRRRHHRPRSARVGAAERQVHPRRRPSPRTTTAPTTATARRFDVGETFSGVDWETGSRRRTSSPRSCRMAFPPAEAALAWVAQHPASAPSSPGRARWSRRARTPPPVHAPRSARPSTPPSHDIYDRRLRAAIHPRW